MKSGRCSGGLHDKCSLDNCGCDCHVPDEVDHVERWFGVKVNEVDVLKELATVTTEVGRAFLGSSGLDPEDALRHLYALRASIELLQALDATLVQRAYLAGEHGDVQIEGLPAARVQRGRERKKWDSRGATFAYLDRKLSETGEVPDPSDVATWLLEVLGVSYLRVTALRAAGLEPDEYCETAPGKISVQFVD